MNPAQQSLIPCETDSAPLSAGDKDDLAGPAGIAVHGDCLDVMQELASDPRFDVQVRLAYLDPPFNTGERFADYHDAMDPTAWLEWMKPRLAATWRMLRNDGSLWVHCDDGEQAALRVAMDELFGREAFVATVVWQRRYSRENRRAFSAAHDYIHVFAPAGSDWKHFRNRLPRNDKPGMWQNRDADPRGPWSTVSLVAQGGHGTPAQFYPITLPSGRVVEPPAGSCWRVTLDKFAALVTDDLIWLVRKRRQRSTAQGLRGSGSRPCS